MFGYTSGSGRQSRRVLRGLAICFQAFIGTSDHSQAVIVTETRVACRGPIICGTEKALDSHGYHQG
jgi:hypothetical protein